MSHFYGTLKGARGEATRCGTRTSRMETHCASWEGAVRCYAYVRGENGPDCVLVELTTWHGAGRNVVLYDGPISGDGVPRDYAALVKINAVADDMTQTGRAQ